MNYLAAISQRTQPPAKTSAKPGEGSSPREMLLRRITARNRSGH